MAAAESRPASALAQTSAKSVWFSSNAEGGEAEGGKNSSPDSIQTLHHTTRLAGKAVTIQFTPVLQRDKPATKTVWWCLESWEGVRVQRGERPGWGNRQLMEYDKEKVALQKQVEMTIERLVLMALSEPLVGRGPWQQRVRWILDLRFCKVSLLLKWDKMFFLSSFFYHLYPSTIRSLRLHPPLLPKGLTSGHHQLLNQFSTWPFLSIPTYQERSTPWYSKLR